MENLRLVEVKLGSKDKENDSIVKGKFHSWGFKTIACRNSGHLLQKSMGIVELDNGKVICVIPNTMRFL